MYYTKNQNQKENNINVLENLLLRFRPQDDLMKGVSQLIIQRGGATTIKVDPLLRPGGILGKRRILEK